MAEFTEVEVLRVYCGESDRTDGRPVYEVVVEAARRHGAAGATVLRGVARVRGREACSTRPRFCACPKTCP